MILIFCFLFLILFFLSFPADYSHVCKVPANYVGDHVIPNSNGMMCDNYVNGLSVASGFQNDPSKAGPLDGLDFSQTYDCSSSSASIKEAVNMVGSTAAGCCARNSGAPESTCFVPPAGICLTDADWTGASTLGQCRDSNGRTQFDFQGAIFDQSSCTAICERCPNFQDSNGNQIPCNDQNSCTGGECKYQYRQAGTDINDCMKDSNGATTSSYSDNVRGRCYKDDDTFDNAITSQSSCTAPGTSWVRSEWVAAVWLTLTWVSTTCSDVGAQAVSAARRRGNPFDFATATCQDVLNTDRAVSNGDLVKYVNQAVQGGCCGSDKKSICWAPPRECIFVLF